jgi:hypothetical protein
VTRTQWCEHVGRILLRDGGKIKYNSRQKNPTHANFRCVLGNGIDGEGRVYRWLLAGPLRFDGVGTPLPDIPNMLLLAPQSGDRLAIGAEWQRTDAPIYWRPYQAQVRDGVSRSPCDAQRTCGGNRLSIDLGWSFSESCTDTHDPKAAIAISYIYVKEDMTIHLAAAADDIFKIWIDGNPELEYLGPPTCLSEQDESHGLRENRKFFLSKGKHIIIAKVGDEGNWWSFSFRMLDQRGSPAVGIVASTSPEDTGIQEGLRILSP